MIPLSIKLKNFLSYGPEYQTITFEPYTLICLAGKNGHGKSSLLDALTWALWGQARKITGAVKADEGLVHLGQEHMVVILDIACGALHYRIKREYFCKDAKGIMYLEFGILEADDQKYKPLTDKTIKATQEKINQVLGLDYEAFTNSAFLRQGQSHEFSKKSPKERKEVLGAILGLDRFEALRRVVLDALKDITTKKEYSAYTLQALTQETSGQAALEDELIAVTTNLETLTRQEHALNEQYAAAASTHQELLAEKSSYDLKKFTYEHTQKSIEHTRTLLQDLIKQWRYTRAAHRQRHVYKALEQEKETIALKLEHYQLVRTTLITLKEELVALKQQEHALLNMLRKQAQEKIDASATLVFKLQAAYESVCLRSTKVDHMLKETCAVREKYRSDYNNCQVQLLAVPQDLEQYLEKRKNGYQRLATRGNLLAQELKQLTTTRSLLENTKATCPVCTQDLNGDKKLHVHQLVTRKERRIQHQIARLTRFLPALKAAIMEHQEHAKKLHELRMQQASLVQTMQHNEQQFIALQNEYKALEQEQNIAQKALKAAHDERDQAQAYYKEIAQHNEHYRAVRARCQEIEARITQTAYDQQEHKACMQRMQEVEQLLGQYTTLLQEQERQLERRQEITRHGIALKELKRLHAEQLQELAHATVLDRNITSINQDLITLKEQLSVTQKRKEQVLISHGSLLQRKTILEQRKQELQRCQQTLNEYEAQISTYQAISQALSKDGIQALIIEEALPEIEREANTLLAKLTDNQAHLSIDSLRALKSGGTRETLDIKISDAAGVRPYELFSGGEAFRIDFALRIAISKLLARRAGAALQTLIIDEGFGSQDEEGISHIIDALHKIQDDFAKIIVVSHLPIIKDQFPVQFVVHKGAQGSKVTVLEHA